MKHFFNRAKHSDMPSQAELHQLRYQQLALNSRRAFLTQSGGLVGAAFLASIIPSQSFAAGQQLDFSRPLTEPLAPLPPQYPAKAKRVIHMHMVGAPSQLELFDYKPVLEKFNGQDTPQSFLEGKQFAFISGTPKLLGPQFPFKQHGQCGAWVSDRMPYLAKHVDDICFIKSMKSDQFNHAPAQLLMHTGSQLSGKPSIGSWATYGLGTLNQNLPGFVSLVSGTNAPDGGKQLWGSGYLPSVYQGVECRSHGDPVLYLSNPKNVSRSLRRRVLDAISDVNQQSYDTFGDPETLTRISQYEMAYRMQMEASDAFDIKKESAQTRESYGAKIGSASFANNCLVARRLAERGVRYIQLFDYGWDSHGSGKNGSLHHGFVDLCKGSDRPIAALLEDLKQRGMLEDTLVIWGGEFGRTPMLENRGGQDAPFAGRDHHPDAFTMWMAGAGVKGGYTHGETDELGYEIVKDKVEIADLHATILYQLGFNHYDLNYRFQGLNQRLTGVEEAHIVSQILR
ncbi:DUF1501 domain-containing protein [Paraglaciecola aquimarina]|uniref:DUF1501 domain-containing protein n=1 Tax=Paraglaciecola aquimarina TaxID=1235557 RepID=A0ABU3SRG3_9ALTE|nr:DUF1501 domain-containing protein [Paraglaciecola aquimarina]MDU0352574.1 DUF1501 domain-containing protein [Paraglaciecola aquimarina]